MKRFVVLVFVVGIFGLLGIHNADGMQTQQQAIVIGPGPDSVTTQVL